MSTQLPLVSAIMPVFNKGLYLIEAVESLAKQNYQNLEVVIVDDGSTDNSWSVIQTVKERFPLLSVSMFQKKNGGASDARNYAIERCKGEFIVNMDADDIMTEGFLHEAVELVTKHGKEIVYSDLELFGDRAGEWVPNPFDPYYIRYDNCVPSLALFRKELWSKVGGYNIALPFSEDWNFFVAISKHTSNFYKIPRKAFRYRQTGTGLYNTFIREAWEWGSGLIMCAQDSLFAVDEVLASCQKLGGMPERWRAKFQQFQGQHPAIWLPSFFCALVSQSRGEMQQAVELYQQACAKSNLKEWLPLYYFGEATKQHDAGLALEAFHRVRTLRPDMGPRLYNQILQLNNAVRVKQANNPTIHTS